MGDVEIASRHGDIAFLFPKEEHQRLRSFAEILRIL